MATSRKQIANTPRPGQGDSTRAAILTAARHVFTAEGYRAATVEGIAAAAGFTKGAFYRHFPSKAAAYAAVMEEAAGESWRVGTSRVSNARTVEEAVSEYVDLVVTIYRRAPFRIGAQLEALVEAEHDREMRSSSARAFAKSRGRLTRALEQAAEREHRVPPVAPAELAGMLIGNTMGAVAQWRVDGDAFDLDAWARTTKAVVRAALTNHRSGGR